MPVAIIFLFEWDSLGKLRQAILSLMIVWSFVVAGVFIKRRDQALRNPDQLRAWPRLTLRLYDTKCPIHSQLSLGIHLTAPSVVILKKHQSAQVSDHPAPVCLVA